MEKIVIQKPILRNYRNKKWGLMQKICIDSKSGSCSKLFDLSSYFYELTSKHLIGERGNAHEAPAEREGLPGRMPMGAGFFLRINVAPSSELADEELVDPKKYLEESCKPKCVKPLLEYQACVKRIQGDESGHKHFTGQYFDHWSCVDKCVAPKLIQRLK